MSGYDPTPQEAQPDGYVYMVPAHGQAPLVREVDLLDLLRALWRSKWLILAATLCFTALGVAYALVATKWYRAEVVLLPVENDPTSRVVSQFGGLASLVGVNLGGSNEAESLAVLRSRDLALQFIRKHQLMPVLFADKWDAARKGWIGPQAKWPDERDAMVMFDKRVRRVVQDRKTGLVAVSMQWKDPAVAASWANAFVVDVNERLRERTITKAQANVEFLRAQIAATDLVALQQPVGRLLELELQKLMLAKNSAQYAFTVVDEARIPKRPESPRKKLAVIGAFCLGFLLSALYVILRHQFKQGRAAARGA
jgi:uncharacterized protein involved in exopolysaccharide biosynthesis